MLAEKLSRREVLMRSTKLTLKFLQIYASNSHYVEEANAEDGSAVAAGITVTIDANAGAETDDDRCAICLEKYIPGDKLAFSRQCCHMFHKQCITEWLLRQDCCPYCRLQFLIPARPSSDLPQEEQRQNEEDMDIQSIEESGRATADFEESA